MKSRTRSVAKPCAMSDRTPWKASVPATNLLFCRRTRKSKLRCTREMAMNGGLLVAGGSCWTGWPSQGLDGSIGTASPRKSTRGIRSPVAQGNMGGTERTTQLKSPKSTVALCKNKHWTDSVTIALRPARHHMNAAVFVVPWAEAPVPRMVGYCSFPNKLNSD